MLLVGGGTGLAPLKSILRHVIECGVDRDIVLYWGARSARDLYADTELQDLARRTARFRYHPVLSDAQASWTGRRGRVHEAVLGDFERLDGLDIYASGPPSMVSAVQAHFMPRGADRARLHVDSVDYAADPLSRQRIMAANKS
jgi:CDP-4-dehydro-6-deoxyglucose reductase